MAINTECPLAIVGGKKSLTTAEFIQFISTEIRYYPKTDPIYCFDRVALVGNKKVKFVQPHPVSVVIAGSSAVAFLCKLFTVTLQWIPKDQDLFFLDSDKEFRHDLAQIDIVAKKAKDVQTLFAGFDLPCCRVAYDNMYIWASLQALRAIFYQHFSLPKIYANINKAFIDKGVKDCDIGFLVDRFNSRLQKYAKRGLTYCFDLDCENPTFLQQLDMSKFTYLTEAWKPAAVDKFRLISDSNVTEPPKDIIDDEMAKDVDAITIDKAKAIKIIKNDNIIDIITTELLALMIATNQTNMIGVMQYLATIDKKHRLDLINTVINSYNKINKIDNKMDIVTYMTLVYKLLN